MRSMLIALIVLSAGSSQARPLRFRVCDPVNRVCRIVTIEEGQPVPLGGVAIPDADPISSPTAKPLGSCGPDCKCVRGECGNPNCPTAKTLVSSADCPCVNCSCRLGECADGQCQASPSAATAEQESADHHDAAEHQVFYGPQSGVVWRHRGPVRRAVCGVLRRSCCAAHNAASGNGPLRRLMRSRRSCH